MDFGWQTIDGSFVQRSARNKEAREGLGASTTDHGRNGSMIHLHVDKKREVAQMSLLLMDQSMEFQRLTNEIFTRQLEHDSRLREKMDNQDKQKMLNGIQNTTNFIYIALKLDDEGLFEKYARWTFQLLCPRVPYYSREQIRDTMVDSYEVSGPAWRKQFQRT